jgi:hypothetical protein
MLVPINFNLADSTVQRPCRHLVLGKRGPWLYQPKVDFLDTAQPSSLRVVCTNTGPLICIGYSTGQLVIGLTLDALLPFWIIDQVLIVI